MKNNKIKQNSYITTFEDIKKRVYETQYRSYSHVNRELIELYWFIGSIIVERQEKENWGDETINRLADDLQSEFPGVKGFSSRNLWKMRQYYHLYKGNIILPTLSAQIGWSQNIEIMSMCKDNLEREYYIRMTKVRGWSVRTLKDKIKNKDFERWAINQNNFESTLPLEISKKGQLLLKDEYNLDFLQITDETKEREIEEKIIINIDTFLREMDGQLMFSGRQVRLEVGDEEFFIDLLFYHKILRSYIVIELKTGKYKPEYTGKLAFYLAAIEDKLIDKEHDNPSIGIILCREKNREVVDTSLKFIARPLGVATYKTYSQTEELPQDIKKYLPTVELLSDKLLAIG